MSRLNGFAIVLLVLFRTGRGAVAQDVESAPSAAHRASASVETSILELDVVVTDKKGVPVSGLGPADFEVRIGKRPVEITNFYERRTAPASLPAAPTAPEGVDLPAPEAEPPAAADRPRRHFILFIDRLDLPEKWKSEGTFGPLKNLLREGLESDDDAMIVTWNRSVKTVLPFTSDLEMLERVLDREEALSRRLPGEAMAIERLASDEAWFRSLPAEANSSVQPLRYMGAAGAYAEMKSKATALRALLATLGGLPGRKVLVFASHRFSERAGLEFVLNFRATFPDASAPVNEFNARSLIDSVVEAANANGVTLYPLYPAGRDNDASLGVSAAMSPSMYPQINSPVVGAAADMIVNNEVGALDTLAERTGGLRAVGAREIGELVPRVLRDLDFSYSLGVAAPLGKPGRDVTVDVKVKDERLVVRSRRSVVAKSREMQIRDRVLSNLFLPDLASGIGISLEKTSLSTKKSRTTLWLPIRIPIAALHLVSSKAGQGGVFSVFVAAASTDGSFSDVTRQRRPFEIPSAGLAKAKAGHFTYEVPVVLGSPEARVSIGVFDEIGNDAGFLLVDVSGEIARVRR